MNGGIHRWWMDGWRDGHKDAQDGQNDGGMDGHRMHRWRDGWTHMDGGMHGEMDVSEPWYRVIELSNIK